MLREIAAKLGVQIDDKDVDTFMSSLDKAKSLLGTFGAALGIGAFVHFAKETIDSADRLQDMSERLGIATEDIERFQYAAKLTGAEVEGVEKSLFIFSKTLGEAVKAGGSDPFSELKINFKDAAGNAKPLMEVLPDVADKIAEAKSEAEKVALATKFFGKSALSLVPLLKRGREGVKELSAEFDDLGLGMSQDMIKQSADFNDQLDRMGFVSKAAGTQIIKGLLPIISFLAKYILKSAAAFNQFAKTTSLVHTGIALLGALLAAKFLPTLISGIGTLMKMRTVVLGTSLPFLLVAAAVAFLYLLFDDLWVLMNGGESVIGDLLVKFGGVEAKTKFVNDMKAAWDTLVEFWKGIDWKAVWAFLSEGQNIVGDLLAALNAVVRVILGAGRALVSLGKLAGMAVNKDWSGMAKEVGEASKTIFGQRNSYWDPKTGEQKEGYVGGLLGSSQAEWNNQMSAAGVPPTINAPVSAPITAKVTVTVPPGTPPGQAAAATVDGVQKGVQGALNNAGAGAAQYIDTAVSDSAPGVK
jgi:hypothetical protein